MGVVKEWMHECVKCDLFMIHCMASYQVSSTIQEDLPEKVELNRFICLLTCAVTMASVFSDVTV